MAIAWRRGFFRLWLVLSALWFSIGIGFGIQHYNSKPYFSHDRFIFGPERGVRTYSEWDAPARAAEELVRRGQLQKTEVAIAPIEKIIHVYYRSEHSGQWEEPVGAFIKKTTDEHRIKVWGNIWLGVQIFVGASAAVFLIGAAISWALTGFRGRS